MLGVVRTAINHVIVEHSLTIPNVFTKLKIKGAGATKHDRLPLSDDQVVTLETAFSSDDTAWPVCHPERYWCEGLGGIRHEGQRL